MLVGSGIGDVVDVIDLVCVLVLGVLGVGGFWWCYCNWFLGVDEFYCCVEDFPWVFLWVEAEDGCGQSWWEDSCWFDVVGFFVGDCDGLEFSGLFIMEG